MERVETEGYIVLAKHDKPKYEVVSLDVLEERSNNLENAFGLRGV